MRNTPLLNSMLWSIHYAKLPLLNFLNIYFAGLPRIHRFILVRRCNGNFFDITVEEKAIYNVDQLIIRQNQLNIYPGEEFSGRGKDRRNRSGTNFESEFMAGSVRSDNVRRASKILQKFVSMPSGLEGSGMTDVVVLAGNILEILAWLQSNDMNDLTEEELGELEKPRRYTLVQTPPQGSILISQGVSSSGLYLWLPHGSSKKIYVIVRLLEVDEPEVHVNLLRAAFEMSPMWLIFYDRDEFEINKFCVDAVPEPKLTLGTYFEKSASPQLGSVRPLLQNLRDMFQQLPCRDGISRGPNALHLQFVFDVTIDYFSDNMVFHTPAQDECEARCEMVTKELFKIPVGAVQQSEADAGLRAGFPKLTTGVSLCKSLQIDAVTGFKVHLENWLKSSAGYTPQVMLSSSSSATMDDGDLPFQVSCSVFPRLSNMPAGKKSTQPKQDQRLGASRSAQGAAAESHVLSAPERVIQALDVIQLPGSLEYILSEWRGVVQVVGYIGAQQEGAFHFLDSLTGSSFGLYPRTGTEPSDAQSSAHHAITPYPMPAFRSSESSLWISCRPSISVLYILLSLEHFPLFEAGRQDLTGIHHSALLATAAALSNALIIQTNSFQHHEDVLNDLLYPAIHTYGQLWPPSSRLLFNNVLIPVTPFASLDQFSSGVLQQIGEDETVDGQLSKYFRAMQPVHIRNPGRTVRKILNGCGYRYDTGEAFLRMLKVVLAAMRSQAMEVKPTLKELTLEHILAGPYQNFLEKVCSKLKEGCTDGYEVEHSMTACVGGTEMTVSIETATLGLLRKMHKEEFNSELLEPTKMDDEQCQYVRTVLSKIARAYSREHSFKVVPPEDLFTAVGNIFQQLAKARERECSDWMKREIAHEPFDGESARERLQTLINSLKEHWMFCGEPCAGHNKRCCYRCLLPRGHSSSDQHTCLDLGPQAHQCEDSCELCRLEKEGTWFQAPQSRYRLKCCTKAAGHQHYTDDYTEKLHDCGGPHWCPGN